MRCENIGNCQLFLGDWREVLNGELKLPKIDFVVSDPPYGANYKSGPNSSKSISSTGKRFTRTIKGDNEIFDPKPWLKYGPCAFTGMQYYYQNCPPGGSIHCWDKRGNYKPLDQADADMIWVSTSLRSRVFHLVWRGICRHAENKQKILHPTQKPVAVMRWMLELLKVKEGQTVLDPYAGVASTGLACMELGINFIGIEIEEEYFNSAVNRLKNIKL